MNNYSYPAHQSTCIIPTDKGMTTESSLKSQIKNTAKNRNEEEDECLSLKKSSQNINNVKLHEILRNADGNEFVERKRNFRGYSNKGINMKKITVGHEIFSSKDLLFATFKVGFRDKKKNPTMTSFYNTKTEGSMLEGNNDRKNTRRGLKITTFKGLRRESMLKIKIPLIQKDKSLLDPQTYNKIVSRAEETTSFGLALKRIRIVNIFLGLFVTANIILTLIDNEMYYSNTDQYIDDQIKVRGLPEGLDIYMYMKERVITPFENTLRGINLVLVVCILFLVYLHYYFSARMLYYNGLLSKFEGIYSAGLIKPMLIEFLILCLTFPPYCNVFIHGKMLGLDYSYNLNSIVCILVTFKSYTILRIYTYFSKWTNDTAKSICNKANVNPGVHFAIKAELKKRPYTMLILFCGCTILILAFSLRTFEYYVITKDKNLVSSKEEKNQQHSISINNFMSLPTSIWLILVTMTTVGYGDYIPTSHYGRFICIISCIIGLLLVSLVVVSFAMVTEFSADERKAYSLLKKLSADQNVNDKAYEVIKCFLRFRKMVLGKGSHKLSRGFILITQLKNAISVFKNDSKLAKSISLPVDKTFKIIQNNFQEKYRLLNAIINRIANIDDIFKRLSSSQGECTEIMHIVHDRQLKLGEYLINKNNTIFKQTILMYNAYANNKAKANQRPMVRQSTKVFTRSEDDEDKGDFLTDNVIRNENSNAKDYFCLLHSSVDDSNL